MTVGLVQTVFRRRIFINVGRVPIVKSTLVRPTLEALEGFAIGSGKNPLQVDRTWLWAYDNKIPIYPKSYLLKGD